MSDPRNPPPGSPYPVDPEDGDGTEYTGRRRQEAASGPEEDALAGWTPQGPPGGQSPGPSGGPPDGPPGSAPPPEWGNPYGIPPGELGPPAQAQPPSQPPSHSSGSPYGPPPGQPAGPPQGPPPGYPPGQPPGPYGPPQGPPQGPPPGGGPPQGPQGPPPGYPPGQPPGPYGPPYGPPQAPPQGPPQGPRQGYYDPAGEDPPPWAALPPSPPARRQTQAGGPEGGGPEGGALDDDLDFDEGPKRRWPFIVIAAVVLAVLGVGGYFGYQTWLAGGAASANPTSEPTADPDPTGDEPTDDPTTEPPPEPEGVEAVRAAIEEQGLECYDTLSDPAPTVTCYGIIDNASSMTLAFQHVDDEITVLRLDASISPDSPGPSIDAYSRVAEGVATAVLEGDGVPLITEGEKEAEVPWGHVLQNVAGNAAAIVLTKADVEPARANSRPLQPGAEELREVLGEQGFDCTPKRCQRVTGEGPAAVTVTADVSTHNVRIEFVLGDEAEPLPEAEVTELMFSITDAVIPESAADVQDWLEAHKQPQLQRADFDGVRISMLWNEGAAPAMTLASASAWPYDG